MSDGLFKDVYKVVSRIPIGKVTTYGHIAEAVDTKDARKVGWALHANKDLKVPCHRVLSKEGKLSESFAFDGWREQRKRLESEGVTFIGEKHVNLEKHLW